MADVRCPMCGKNNPAAAEICQHCGARLTPVIGQSGKAGGDEPDWLSQLRSEDAAGQPGEPLVPGEPAAEPEPGGQPDWLARVRQQSQSNSSEPDWLKEIAPDAGPSAAGKESDWLSSLRGGAADETEEPSVLDESSTAEETASQETLAASSSDVDLKAWLQGLDEQEGRTGQEMEWAGQGGEKPVSSGTGITGFLRNIDLDEPIEPVPPVEPVPPAPEEGLPGWLTGLGDPIPMPAGQSQEPAPEFTDFMKDLNEPQALEEQPPAQPADELPAWMGGLGDAAAQEPASQESTPDFSSFLNNLQAEPAAEEPAAQPAAEPAPEEGLPSWLTGLGGDEPPAVEQTPVPAGEAVPEVAPDLSAWLSNLGGDEPAAPEAVEPVGSLPSADYSPFFRGLEPDAEETAGPAAAEQPEIPAWMSDAGDGTVPGEPVEDASLDLEAFFNHFDSARPEAEQSAPIEPEAEGTTPDWVAKLSAVAPQDQQPAAGDGVPPVKPPAAPVAAAAEPELPAWMAAFAADEPQAAAPVSPEVKPSAAEPPSQARPESNESVPDWMTDFEQAGTDQPGQAEEAPVSAEPEGPSPFIDESLPSWLSNIPAAGQAKEEPGFAPLIEEPSQPMELESAPFQVDLPDWMNQSGQSEAGDTAEENAEPGEQLAAAELPSWVEEMRPIESVMPGAVQSTDAADQQVEKAGPLMGLRGILPAEDSAFRYRKLPVYSAKLHVSERQRQNATLLENVLALESQPHEVTAEASSAPQTILRLLVGLLLMVVMVVTLIFGIQITPVSKIYPPEISAMHQQIDALPENVAVLVAADYEASLSGEMKTTASAVIEHLMARKARITVVSTVPTGPVLADELLRSVALRVPGYDLKQQSVNLSYLPGGTTSLLEFAQRPRQAAPVAMDYYADSNSLPAWQRPALLGVNSLKDFGMILVLTDSSETGRAWVEQVQPMLGTVPLGMVTSAQAAPMLMPYVDSGQVKGLVSGLTGGASYEGLSGRASLAQNYWGAYQVGMLVGILLLLLGWILSSVLSLTGAGRKGKGKAL